MPLCAEVERCDLDTGSSRLDSLPFGPAGKTERPKPPSRVGEPLAQQADSTPAGHRCEPAIVAVTPLAQADGRKDTYRA